MAYRENQMPNDHFSSLNAKHLESQYREACAQVIAMAEEDILNSPLLESLVTKIRSALANDGEYRGYPPPFLKIKRNFPSKSLNKLYEASLASFLERKLHCLGFETNIENDCILFVTFKKDPDRP
jgi:hypothetical protein